VNATMLPFSADLYGEIPDLQANECILLAYRGCMTSFSPDLSYSQAHSAHGLTGVGCLAATRAFYRHQPRWLKRRVVNGICRLLADLLSVATVFPELADEPEKAMVWR
jgi:hypothetical protein